LELAVIGNALLLFFGFLGSVHLVILFWHLLLITYPGGLFTLQK